ncbi:bacteriohemerythrin [Anaeromyxobacter sp. PSR-1]|uniref:bacteriohemerythrin n=2 Tax=unclassified Anaeromyxobacter TaxID=2620896 RepID=UPI001ED99461|nr:bacteriohemerythrin [Anaeromyxobacter sp. PSR-1]
MEWTARLAVGIDDIDAQHRELFRRVNGLVAAMGERRGREELAEVIAFLRAYVDVHFEAEARLMARTRYPGRAFHAAEHAHFRAQVEELAARIAAEGPESHHAVKLGGILCDWLRQHVLLTDRQLADHVRAEDLLDEGWRDGGDGAGER